MERIDNQDDPPPSASKPGEGFDTPKSEKKRARGDLRGIRLGNDTDRSSSDPEARLCRKTIGTDKGYDTNGFIKEMPLQCFSARKTLENCHNKTWQSQKVLPCLSVKLMK